MPAYLVVKLISTWRRENAREGHERSLSSKKMATCWTNSNGRGFAGWRRGRGASPSTTAIEAREEDYSSRGR